VNASLLIPALITLVGSLAGGAVGHHVANILQAQRHNDPEWANLDPAFTVLFAVLFARTGLELGRWILALRSGEPPTPLAGKPLVMLARALARVAAAAIGLRLGFEAGMVDRALVGQLGQHCPVCRRSAR
jgi:hypothetical protein